MLDSNPYATPQADLGKTSFKIYPTREMLQQLSRCWMCCYVYAIAIVFMFVDAFLAGAANIVTLRDFVSLIFYAVAGYFLHKDKFIWAPVVLVFYVLDKLLFSFDFGIISHWTLQIPFFAGFLSGSIAFLRYHFYQQKKTAEYAQARFSSGED